MKIILIYLKMHIKAILIRGCHVANRTFENALTLGLALGLMFLALNVLLELLLICAGYHTQVTVELSS